MDLDKYIAKRNFSETPEPKAILKTFTSPLSFVVQRHKASQLHYDFRLELSGVLKSWAVPKGPSMNPKDKRLAMMVEDHPYDYKDFEGVIPEGNYGAGIVEIWDKGTYTDMDSSDYTEMEKNLYSALTEGNLKIKLSGEKLKGEFTLLKLKKSKDNAWLLIKNSDEYATHETYNSENKTDQNSPINKWFIENKKSFSVKKK